MIQQIFRWSQEKKSLVSDREEIYVFSCNQELKSEYLSWAIKILLNGKEASRFYTTSSFDSEKNRVEFKKCKESDKESIFTDPE